MQQIQTAPAMLSSQAQVGARIPALKHDEAIAMTAEELRRFIALIETLEPADWDKPTACSLWSVRDIVAHQGAHVTSFVSLGDMLGQLKPSLLRPYLKRGMGMLDAWNQSQVDLRRQHTPAQLIAEIRGNADASLRGKDRIPAWLRAPALPAPGLDQPRSLGYVFDLIYTRDMWMHRLDICRATGRAMPLDATHDRRVVALVVRDFALKCRSGLQGRSALLTLMGVAGGTFHIGSDDAPSATVEFDTLDFCILTSGREKAANFLREGRVILGGDAAFGREIVDFSENRVLY